MKTEPDFRPKIRSSADAYAVTTGPCLCAGKVLLSCSYKDSPSRCRVTARRPSESTRQWSLIAGFTRGGGDETLRETHRVTRQEGRRPHMLATTEHLRRRTTTPTDNRNRAIAVENRTRSCGFAQGGWWPRSTRLTIELPSLLKALSRRFGSIAGVRYHQSDWSPSLLASKTRAAR